MERFQSPSILRKSGVRPEVSSCIRTLPQRVRGSPPFRTEEREPEVPVRMARTRGGRRERGVHAASVCGRRSACAPAGRAPRWTTGWGQLVPTKLAGTDHPRPRDPRGSSGCPPPPLPRRAGDRRALPAAVIRFRRGKALTGGASTVECGDSSPLWRGDWSPSDDSTAANARARHRWREP